MLELIAMWGGVAGCILALVAIIAIIVIKIDIKHALNKDKILFDQNFELKKQAIELAMSLADELEANGEMAARSADFQARAKSCYNQLLCVCTDMRLPEAFYLLTQPGTNVSQLYVNQFKLKCRKDIGLSIKNAQLVKRAKVNETEIENKSFSNTMPQPIRPEYVEQPRMREQTRPIQQPQPTQPVRTQQGVRPVGRPVQSSRPEQPIIQNPVRPVASQPMRKTDHD